MSLLPPRPRQILDRLAEHPGPVSRWALVDQIAPGSEDDGVLRTYISRLRDALGQEFSFAPPADYGLDSVDTIRAMRDGRVRAFLSMGGNFVSATPDTAATAEAMRGLDLTVNVSTKLNRSHVTCGQESLIPR